MDDAIPIALEIASGPALFLARFIIGAPTCPIGREFAAAMTGRIGSIGRTGHHLCD